MQTAKIFTNGKSQAVRLPKEFRFSGTEVYIRRIGNAVILLPAVTTQEVSRLGKRPEVTGTRLPTPAVG